MNKSLYLVCFALAISVFALAPKPARFDIDADSAGSSTSSVRATGSPTHTFGVSYDFSRGPTGK